MNDLSALYTTGFFEEQASRSLQSARVVLPELFALLQPARVVDVGCGVGAWLRIAAELGAGDILGVDGDYVDSAMLMIDRARFVAGDLITTRLPEVLRGRIEGRFDLAMCLEFAEHIPFERAAALVEDLTALSDTILFSAAVPFQYGIHHVNEQWPGYWAIRFRARGYYCYDWIRQRVWDHPDVDWWYAQNMLLFVKEGSVAAARLPAQARVEGGPLAFVHPENFLANVLQLYRTNGKRAYSEEAEDFRSLVRANQLRSTSLPPLQAIARADAAGPDARDVFPWTRTELGKPEEVADELQKTATALTTETKARLHAEASCQQESARRAAAERAFREELTRRTAAERAQTSETELRRQAEAAYRQEINLRTAAEAALATEAEQRRRAEAAYDHIENATFWKLSYPLRYAGRRLPVRMRRVLRRVAEIVWWSLGRRLQRRRTEERGIQHDPGARSEVVVSRGDPEHLRQRISACKLFDPDVYLSLHPDLRDRQVDAWDHYLRHGYEEGRQFSNCEIVASVLAELRDDLDRDARRFKAAAERRLAAVGGLAGNTAFQDGARRIGIFCNREGNFYMHEIANLLALGLREEGIDTVQRDESSDQNETFDLRIFVAPHEFFYVGSGREWLKVASDPNTVLYNVEQMHTPWFCRAFPLLLNAPLVIDINFQYAEILRRAGCNAVHFMPGYTAGSSYAQACVEVSHIELLKGYDFAKCPYNWREHNRLDDRPIDLLFIGTGSPRREQTLARLQETLDSHRFICVCTRQQKPLTSRDNSSTSTDINCALGQRAKIVLNIHRDWLGYFEWSRMVLQGLWQGACVVSEATFPHPLFQPGVHYLEESTRHIGELVRWLLETPDGREKLDSVRLAGYQNAITLGAMPVALAPVIKSAAELLERPSEERAARHDHVGRNMADRERVLDLAAR